MVAQSEHQLITELFLATVDLEPIERERLLNARCRETPAIRSAVEAMLEADSSCSGGLSSPLVPDGDRAIPDRIGSFEIVGVIGAGGMGVVYEARQTAPDRRVALKVLRNGAASESLLERFRLEAELLGQLQHPGIAQIYEAGTHNDAGVRHPYYAMELVDGEPIDRFVRERTTDSLQAIDLIRQAAEAVHHAHQRGVVHRDLKPENILVTTASDGRQQTKILDFGVALRLNAEERITQFGSERRGIVGTLGFMSPEQLTSPREIDTRSDIYSLGVIAYELLAGEPPYALGDLSIEQASRLICQGITPKLKDLPPRIRRDAEAILATAMATERDRRYTSAAEFAADLRRLGTGQPVAARRPTAAYLFSRFVRRNPWLTGTAAAATIAVLAGIIGTSWQARAATIARDRAERTAQVQAQVLRSIDPFEFGATLRRELRTASGAEEDPEAARLFVDRLNITDLGVRALSEQVLGRAERALDEQLSDDPEMLARLRREVAYLYENLDADDDAYRMWGLVRDGTSDPELSVEARWGVGLASRRLARHSEATELLNAAEKDAVVNLGAAHPITLKIRESVAGITFDVGDYESALQQAEGLSERVVLPRDDDLMAKLYLTRHDCLFNLQRLDEADVLLNEYLDFVERSLGRASDHWTVAQRRLGRLRSEQGRYDEAIPVLEEVRDTLSDQLGSHHSRTFSAEQSLGQALREGGRLEEAAIVLESAYERASEVLGTEHLDLLNLLNDLALLYEDLGRLEEAERASLRSLGAKRRVYGAEHPHTLIAANNLGMLYRTMERWDEAAALLADTYKRRVTAIGADHLHTLGTGYNAADSLIELGDGRQALRIARAVVAAAEESLGPDDFYTAVFRLSEARALNVTGDHEAARAELMRVAAVFASSPPPQRFADELAAALSELP
ncbi:MAG: serine/threonine-protein kinase [Planctomycetota bacterium]